MEALKAVWSQLVKDFDKAPGWLPLLVCSYLMLALYGAPASVEIAGVTLPLSVELLAGLLTLIFYQFGDAVDEWIFKTGSGTARATRTRYRQRYLSEQRHAQERLGVTAASYGVAIKLVDAAEKDRPTIIVHLFNEAAKFLRGVALPLTLLAVLALSQHRAAVAVALAVAGLFAFAVYPFLKVQHIKRLYSLASLLTTDPRYAWKDLEQVRLFFWEGSLVASACRSAETVPA
jgi:hypothetical protein